MPKSVFCKFTVAMLAAAALALPLATCAAHAEDAYSLTLKDHAFSPTMLQVPANTRFRVEVSNQDPTPAEFESTDLKVEKIVVGGGRIVVYAGPLKPGTYNFFDDYHPDQAKGTITAK